VDLDLRQLCFDLCELLVGQVDVGGAQVFLMRSSLRELGMGTMKSFFCSIQANEIWAGVTPLLFAKSVIKVQQGLVRADVVLVKSGDDPPHIVTGVGVVCSDLGGQNVHGQALALWASHVGD
jgi:hypothetical protein